MKALLFNTSAAVAGISAIHHVFRGPHELYPAFNGLMNKPRRAARTAWDYMVVSYIVTICLNIKWARVGGPKGIEEQSVLGAMAVGGLIEGCYCVLYGEYMPLVAFFGIPALSLAASLVN